MGTEVVTALASLGVSGAFAAWVCFGNGARWLESRPMLATLLVSWLAHRWTADGIKLFVGGGFVLYAVVTVVMLVLYGQAP